MAPNHIHFHPGTIVTTDGALQIADNRAILELIGRHLAGDWGDVSADDARANDHALTHGGRVLSSYTMPGGEKLWVETTAERSQTTVFTPEEH